MDKQDVADIKTLLRQIAENTKPPRLAWRILIAVGTVATAASIFSVFDFIRSIFLTK